jgi:hypothetical protein
MLTKNNQLNDYRNNYAVIATDCAIVSQIGFGRLEFDC